MSFVIIDTCAGVKDASCVTVCPVDCIITNDEQPQYFINPDECIDCGACVPECPVNAIYNEQESLPNGQEIWIQINKDFGNIDDAAFNAQHGEVIAAAKEQNKDGEYADAALYS